ncbi:MAG: hypothetical protein M3256_12770 [Actinomycetota bacterium]|nr:hypothetical protein [Actinomycetota bacterium]
MTCTQVGSAPPSKNWRTRLVGALLIVQSLGFGCGGFMTLIYATVFLWVTVTSGLRYLLLAIAAGVVAAALIGLAAALWVLALKFRWRLKPWILIVIATEVILTPVGSILFGLETQAQPTDGPFSEGGDAYIILFGFALAACGAVVLAVLLWESATGLHKNRHS